MNSEKVEEIKTALECCTGRCNETCPYYTKPCITDLSKDSLTLINELESENEKLNSIHTNLKINYNKTWKDYREYEVENQQLKDRIAELEEYIEGNEQDAKAFVNGWHKDLETELKQFAERLKEKAIRRQEFIGELVIDDIDYVKTQDIDKTLKEFLNK